MKPFDLNTQKQFYLAAMIVVVVELIGVIVISVCDINLTTLFPGCIFKEMTGYNCPGCGGTRAVIALLQGHFFQSFCYHPIVLYTIFLEWMLFTSSWLSKRGIYASQLMLRPVHFYTFIVLLIANFFIKNWMRACL